MKNVMGVFVAFGLLGSFPAFGADGAVDGVDFEDCTCVATTDKSSGSIGLIVSVAGEVLYTGSAGYMTGEAGAELWAGSQVSVGTSSTAEISVGSCDLSIAANSLVSLSQNAAGGDICVMVRDISVSATADGGAGNGSTLLAIGGGALVVTGGILAISQ